MKVIYKDLGDWKSIADITSVAMEHENRYIASMLFVGSNVESAERFAVWRWNKQLFEVIKSKLGRAWNVGQRIRWKCSWVDELTDQVSG